MEKIEAVILMILAILARKFKYKHDFLWWNKTFLRYLANLKSFRVTQKEREKKEKSVSLTHF